VDPYPSKDPYSTPESKPSHYEKSPAGDYLGPGPDDNARQWGMLAHLLGWVITVFSLLGVIGPLIVLMTKKDEHPFINDQATEAVNFQITLLLINVVFVVIAIATCGVGGVLFLITYVMNIILGIIAMINANKGVAYRYPMTIRLIK
jgi:uncharacterized Tic20 family protein